jgi:Anti-sigma-28 factor, FlgM
MCDPADRNVDPSLERQMKIDSLKARIERADYDVDPEAVAEALIRRMRLTGSPALPAVNRRGARSRAPRAPRRPR